MVRLERCRRIGIQEAKVHVIRGRVTVGGFEVQR
jgi:hypothetical protein